MNIYEKSINFINKLNFAFIGVTDIQEIPEITKPIINEEFQVDRVIFFFQDNINVKAGEVSEGFKDANYYMSIPIINKDEFFLALGFYRTFPYSQEEKILLKSISSSIISIAEKILIYRDFN